MQDYWNAFLTGLSTGDPLTFAAVSFVAGLVAYALVRRMMRVRWLRIAMRIGYFAGVLGLVGLAVFMASYYQPDAWLPLGGSMLLGAAGSPILWIVGAVTVAAGLALRKPVPPRHGIRVTTVPPPRPVAVPLAAAEDANAAPVPDPWRNAA